MIERHGVPERRERSDHSRGVVPTVDGTAFPHSRGTIFYLLLLVLPQESGIRNQESGIRNPKSLVFTSVHLFPLGLTTPRTLDPKTPRPHCLVAILSHCHTFSLFLIHEEKNSDFAVCCCFIGWCIWMRYQ